MLTSFVMILAQEAQPQREVKLSTAIAAGLILLLALELLRK